MKFEKQETIQVMKVKIDESIYFNVIITHDHKDPDFTWHLCIVYYHKSNLYKKTLIDSWQDTKTHAMETAERVINNHLNKQ